MWDALGRQVAGRNYHPTNKNTLIRALTEEWDKLPQQLLDNVLQDHDWLYQELEPVGQRCSQNLSTAETSSRWCRMVVRRGGASSGVVHVRCQEVRRPKPS
ncbi:hypothetical protein TNCV_151861 [Trichonephila clavipes]|uniref:Uncharacterized protein n=1 Tax=Trichonephila clavipes TaxID=2585209 RepID=A0A8X6REX0_TRICX|nr:hypothetical protein TNCV_151861 [Trichonephila clavipes]